MVLQTLRRQPFVLDYAIRMEQTFFESGQKGFTGHRHVELERDSRSSRMVGGETEDLSHGENLVRSPFGAFAESRVSAHLCFRQILTGRQCCHQLFVLYFDEHLQSPQYLTGLSSR